jgi:hypothetical protein
VFRGSAFWQIARDAKQRYILLFFFKKKTLFLLLLPLSCGRGENFDSDLLRVKWVNTTFCKSLELKKNKFRGEEKFGRGKFSFCVFAENTQRHFVRVGDRLVGDVDIFPDSKSIQT